MPIFPNVVNAIKDYYALQLGNPASRHLLGKQASDLYDRAVNKIATYLRALPREFIWTSGATEANTLAIKTGLETLKARF